MNHVAAARAAIERDLDSLGCVVDRCFDPSEYGRATEQLSSDAGSFTIGVPAIPPRHFQALIARDDQGRVGHCQAFRIDSVRRQDMEDFVIRYFDSFAPRVEAFALPTLFDGVGGLVAYRGDFKIGNGLKGRRLAAALGVLGTCDLLLEAPNIDFSWAVFDPPAVDAGAPAWAAVSRYVPVETEWVGWLKPASCIGVADRITLHRHAASL